MDSIVSLCKRRGFLFQSSEIYGGIQGFWDYGPLGVELKRNVREAWWRDMINAHDAYSTPEGAPSAFGMVGIEASIIMHPQVWKCSGHYDLFHDFMVDCKECKSRFRVDHIQVALASSTSGPARCETYIHNSDEAGYSGSKKKRLEKAAGEGGSVSEVSLDRYPAVLAEHGADVAGDLIPRCPVCTGELTAPREFNLMFKTIVGALGTEEDAAFLRPETAQGIFVNFKNVLDSARVKIPFGIGQIGKSFRNEITPRNFTFRSREFEQMEIEFFCHPETSQHWYKYWRDRRMKWYKELGLSEERLILREHDKAELSHYSTGTADVEYAFPFLPEGEYGELEGIAHRGDFDLRSHMEGKLDEKSDPLVLQLDADGNPKWKGSGKDLQYFDDQTRERFTPHVIEPSAGADRATLAFLCEAYTEDEAPDDQGNLQKRTLLKLNPRLAPVKAAIFPLIKKEGLPEVALGIYREMKSAGLNVVYSQQGAIGRRYRQQDEIGTPWCITIDVDSVTDGAVTIRDRDTLEQTRVPVSEVTSEIQRRLRG
ncbi:MAG: glycine--tRNA ligase [Planctomycetota bacterium]|nr:glycine--tRNA ligase [Planctomycetota bacterium]